MNGINRITDRIAEDAAAAAAAAESKARGEAAAIAEDYKRQADAIRSAGAEKLANERQTLLARGKSSAEMIERNLVIEAKGRFVDKAYKDALAQLLGLPDKEYIALLYSILSSALRERAETDDNARRTYGDDDVVPVDSYIVKLSARDLGRFSKGFVSGFEKSVKGSLPDEMLAKLILSDKPAGIDGGLILAYGDIESNCSFSMLVSQSREKSEGEVYSVLFGKEGQ